MTVNLQWATPDIDKQIMFMARVSNPENQNSENSKLLHYCMEHGHVSPFEMASACLEINTTRDIGRQILRHRSFSFQEFSQRYQDVDKLPPALLREYRKQDTKNRQNSLPSDGSDHDLENQMWWFGAQLRLLTESQYLYETALKRGVAKEQARALLPEGLTMSRMYMTGTMRSWIHYLQQRLHESTQKEHRTIAQEVFLKLRDVAPITMTAFFQMRKQTKYRLTPVEKAVMRQKWGSAALKAHLQALAGENWNTVVENVAILTFIVGGAADVDKVPNTDPDLRILAGTANALMEIAYNEGIRSADRGALSAGIMTIERLVPRLTDHAMITASMSAQVLMTQGGIYGKHFQDVFKR